MFPNFAPKFVDRLAPWMVIAAAVTGALLVLAGVACGEDILPRGEDTAARPVNTILITRTVDGQDWNRMIPNDQVPLADFKALEHAIEVDGQPRDRVRYTGEIVGGEYDMLDLSKIVGGELTGAGAEHSRLIFKAQHDRIGPVENPIKPGGPALLLPDNGTIRLASMYLENTPINVQEDGALAGWPGGWNGTAIVTAEDLVVKAHDWGLFYDWSLRSNRTINMRRVKGVAARDFVNLMHSGSNYTLNMEDCEIGIDGNLSQSAGATSDADLVTGGVLSPIMLRAGSGTIRNCSFWVKGMTPPPGHPAKWVPRRIAAVCTDQFYSQAAKSTNLAFTGCRVLFVEPGVATEVRDTDMRFGTATWDNSAAENMAKAEAAKLIATAKGGSGPGGELVTWSPPVVKASALASEEETKPD